MARASFSPIEATRNQVVFYVRRKLLVPRSSAFLSYNSGCCYGKCPVLEGLSEYTFATAQYRLQSYCYFVAAAGRARPRGLKTSRCLNVVERPDGVAGRGASGETLQEDQPWRTLHRGRGVAVKRSAADIQARRYRFLPLGASRVFRQPRVTSPTRYPCGSVPLGSESRKRLGTSCKGYDRDSSASWLSSAESKSVTRIRARSDLPASSGDAAFR
jgi:hypothetical protein